MRVKVIESTSDDVDIILSLIRLLAESDGVKNVSIGKDALLTNICLLYTSDAADDQ